MAKIISAKIPSAHIKDKYYDVVISDSGFFFCSCPNFINRLSKKADMCKHLKAFLGTAVKDGIFPYYLVSPLEWRSIYDAIRELTYAYEKLGVPTNKEDWTMNID